MNLYLSDRNTFQTSELMAAIDSDVTLAALALVELAYSQNSFDIKPDDRIDNDKLSSFLVTKRNILMPILHAQTCSKTEFDDAEICGVL